MARKSEQAKTLVFSYLQLRQVIGWLGIALPFVLAFGVLVLSGQGVQSSISYYYWTLMRDVLVGTLFAIGFFLFSYQGYDRADNIAGNLACVFAIGVALFPTDQSVDPSGQLSPRGVLHLVFAAAFFGTLTYFCLVLFVKTKKGRKPTAQKVIRNRIYRACGIIMAACILATAISQTVPGIRAMLAPVRPVYWLEAIAILAFGFSWIVKGEAILKDE